MIDLDHVTIRTHDVPAARTFFEQVFDLSEGPRPVVLRHIPGTWLYGDGHPIVHIIAAGGHGRDTAAEAIDHVGFRLGNYWRFRSKLDRLGIPYSLQDIDELGERRVFLRAPGGPLLEAVFDEPIGSVAENAPDDD